MINFSSELSKTRKTRASFAILLAMSLNAGLMDLTITSSMIITCGNTSTYPYTLTRLTSVIIMPLRSSSMKWCVSRVFTCK